MYKKVILTLIINNENYKEYEKITQEYLSSLQENNVLLEDGVEINEKIYDIK